MDFWRAYRVLARRKWIILLAVALTMSLAVGGLKLWGSAYDATTVFGPTDQAVSASVNAGNDAGGPQSLITTETRKDEVNSIATLVQTPSNISAAVFALARAQFVFDALNGKSRELNGEAFYQEGALNPPGYDNVVYLASETLRKLPTEQWQDIAKGRTIDKTVLPDFIYLISTLKYHGVSMEFLQDQNLGDTMNDLNGKLEANGTTKSIQLSARHRNPRIAEALVDAVTLAYKASYDKQARQGAEKQRKFYALELKQAEQNLARQEAALHAWQVKNKDLMNKDQMDNAIRRSELARAQIEGLTAKLKDMDAQIAAKKARLASTEKMLRHTEKTEDPEIAKLRDQITGLRADLALKRGTLTENNPEVKRAKEQLASVTQRYNQVKGSMITGSTVTENDEWTQLDREVAGLEQQRAGISKQMAVLNQEMAAATALVGKLPTAGIEAEKRRSAYANAMNRVGDLGAKLRQANDDLAKAINFGSLQVQFWAGLSGSEDHPESPAQPGAKKKTMMMLAAAFLMSLLLSAGLVLGLDLMDTSIKTSFDVERMLDVPVNGIVPRLDGPSRAMLPQVTHALPGSPHAESYRFLGTDILLSATGDDPYKTIMVATAKPGQGGTSTICNLAITLAQAGQSVVLVDADLRRPSLHHIFNLENEHGLTSVLSNGRLPSDVLQRTEIENLYVMTGGPKAENAWKLLRSGKMREVIVDLSRDFDFVLFDTPSAVVFADAATLATMVDGVLLVVRAHEAPSGSELQVKNLLNKTKARIIGVVLNDMPAQQVDSARFFNHYYAPGTERQEAVPAAGRSKTALPTRGSDDEI